jgi:probable F420-dependent oxidoreductase
VVADVRFGVSFGSSPFGVPDREFVLAFPRRIEDLGFDSLWTGDHVLMRTDRLHSLTFLAAAIPQTARLRLGTAIYLLPLRPAADVARAVATLDYLSGGRIVFGLGVGGEYAPEWEACGVPREDRGRRMDEGIEILRRLWRDDAVTFEGRYATLRDAAIRPKPAQPGGPPLWIGGRSDAALRRAAVRGDGWVAYLVSPRRYGESIGKIAAFAAEAGRTLPADFGHAHLQFTYVSDDREQARQRAIGYLERNYAQDFDRFVDAFCVVGPVEQCVERLLDFVRAGVRHFIFRIMAYNEELPAQLDLYARDIIPAVRRAAAAL